MATKVSSLRENNSLASKGAFQAVYQSNMYWDNPNMKSGTHLIVSRHKLTNKTHTAENGCVSIETGF